MKRPLPMVFVLFLLCLAPAFTFDLPSVFDRSGAEWKATPADLVSPRFVATELGNGFEFNADHSQADPKSPRNYWDTTFSPIDLSSTVSVVMWMKIENAAAVRTVSFYFKSGDGWYLIKPYTQIAERWNKVVFHLDNLSRAEGKPSGWNSIDGLRVNVFFREKAPCTVTIVGIRTSATRIEEKGDVALFEAPDKDKGLTRTMNRDANGRLIESRMILDEKGAFLDEGSDVVLDRIKRAGFNAYMPCIWHGRGAIFRSAHSPVEPRFEQHFAGTNDATAVMIQRAKDRGIEVHAWFCVAPQGKNKLFPEFAKEGSPKGAYDLQDPGYRDLIVREITSFAKQYAVDGINLDYIRTMGISFTETARALYRKRYNADIDELKGTMTPALTARLLEWQEAAVSDIVRRASEGIRAARPKAVFSVCGHALPKPELSEQGRNEWLWIENGWLDISYTMDYDWTPNFPKFEAGRTSLSSPGRSLLMLGNYESERGEVKPRNAMQVARLIEYALKKYPEGIALYYYPTLSEEQIDALRAGPFKENAVPNWPSR
ncbi:MAG: family 10 glycosylhydrolase [Spirochaetota bacterium]